MQEIEKRLSEMSAAGASDLLLTVGACPQLRVLGILRAVGQGAPSFFCRFSMNSY